MEPRKLTASQLAAWAGSLEQRFTVLGPVREEGNVFFQELKGRPLALDFANTKNAPKNAFFRHTETLVRYTRTPKGMEATAQGDAPAPSVIFARPCDVKSFGFLDKVFGQQPYLDPYYLGRREAGTVVALGCSKPPYASCFCVSMEGAPLGSEGADILVTDVGDGYLVEFLTPKGQALAETLHGAAAASKADQDRKGELAASAKAAVRADVPGRAAKAPLDAHFDHPYWAGLPARCLACGTCTYVCPTCHCFDISDEVKGEGGVRLRNWDSCMFPLFTRETSGHNPRPSQKERWRQRVMHKFRYIPENFGDLGCVGCGRCVLQCPVNLDIRKIVEDVSKL